MSGPGPVPRSVRLVTIGAVSVVAAVAAVASYVHMHELATDAGEGWRALLIPLSVDGMLVAASMVMLVRRRAGLPAGLLPWLGLVLGIAASLGANVAAASPNWLSWIVSGWPPLALAVSFELLILVTRDQPADPPPGDEEPEPPAEPEAGDDRVAELIAAGLGRRRLSKQLAISESQARALVDAHRNGATR